MAARKSEIHAKGRAIAVTAYKHIWVQKKLTVDGSTPPSDLRSALDKMHPQDEVDRRVAQFWLDLSPEQFQKRIRTAPPPTPYVPGQQGKASRTAVLDWDAAWRLLEEGEAREARDARRARIDREAEAAVHQLRAGARTNAVKFGTLPWLVVAERFKPTLILGNADAIHWPTDTLVDALHRGATVSRRSMTWALARQWVSDLERTAWEGVSRFAQ